MLFNLGEKKTTNQENLNKIIYVDFKHYRELRKTGPVSNSLSDLKLREKEFMFITSNKNVMLQDACGVRATEVKVEKNVSQKKMSCCK